jgi:hypothetical protein
MEFLSIDLVLCGEARIIFNNDLYLFDLIDLAVKKI